MNKKGLSGGSIWKMTVLLLHDDLFIDSFILLFRSVMASRNWRRVSDSLRKLFSTQFALPCLQPAAAPPLPWTACARLSPPQQQQRNVASTPVVLVVGLRFFVVAGVFAASHESILTFFAALLLQLHLQAWRAYSSALSGSPLDKHIYWYNGQLYGKLSLTKRFLSLFVKWKNVAWSHICSDRSHSSTNTLQWTWAEPTFFSFFFLALVLTSPRPPWHSSCFPLSKADPPDLCDAPRRCWLLYIAMIQLVSGDERRSTCLLLTSLDSGIIKMPLAKREREKKKKKKRETCKLFLVLHFAPTTHFDRARFGSPQKQPK